MKTLIKKTASLLLTLLIPAAILIGCQEDLQEPSMDGVPEPSEVVTPPKKK